MRNKNLFTVSVIFFTAILAGCGAISSAESEAGPVAVKLTAETPQSATPEPVSSLQPPLAQLEIPVPENELVEGDYSWSQLLARDAIFPVYEPEFAPGDTAPYDDDELVIGVEINGEAKAYAIGPLNGREMVNDTIGGVPILVTW